MKNLTAINVMNRIMGIINIFSLCIVSHKANLACDWLYYQEEEPEAVKKYRKF